MGMFLHGMSIVCTAPSILTIFLGVWVGIIFGAIPGLTAGMAVVLCLPISYGMDPMLGMSLLIALQLGGVSGGLISAVLLKIPGTPSSVATTFDGGPMAEKGEAGKALGVSIVFSAIGTCIGLFMLATVSPLLAKVALRFGSYEYFAVGVFSLSLIATLVKGSVFKGLASAAVGLCVAMAGLAPIDATPRFTFGIRALNGGFALLPVLIGLFAVSEMILTAEEGIQPDSKVATYKVDGIFGFSSREFIGQLRNMVRSAAIGVGIGILPGIGGGTSNMLSYMVAKNRSKYPEKFGTGIIDGLVASETANNATSASALIPMLSLGIPGDPTSAMILGGLILHGLTPGPMLFVKNTDLMYGIFATLFIANIFVLIMEFAGLRFFVRVLSVPRYILLPVVVMLCVVGSFGTNNRLFDVSAILCFGILGYLFKKFTIPTTPFILGFILSPMVETNLRRALMSSKGSLGPFLTRPITVTFLTVALTVILYAVFMEMRGRRERRT